jgi:asparagine synthase (glutamine-hydrolysing)
MVWRRSGYVSGIAGIYHLGGRPCDSRLLKSMTDSISHRGPDGEGHWVSGSIGLGHRMLWTTPESCHERLPFAQPVSGLSITADARIDNREELFAALDFDGRPKGGIADSELILAAYEKWGEECPKYLLGDFSFAIWDSRNKKLFCARDPLGIKPFFYYMNKNVFRWASETDAIFEDKDIPKEPNRALICLYFLKRFDERERTLFRDILRLPPGHSLVVENGGLRKREYWNIDPKHEIYHQNDGEYAEHFLSLFKEAVRVRMRGYGSLGILVSGGLDSSSIACTAQMISDRDSVSKNGFETFSVVFDGLPCDERKYIDEVVGRWRMKANLICYERNLFVIDFEENSRSPDMNFPLGAVSIIPAMKAAKEKGIRIMLNGFGGDDFLAAGFDHLTDFFTQGRFRKLMAQLKFDAHLSPRSPLSLFLNYCVLPSLPHSLRIPLRKIKRLLLGNGFPSWVNKDCLRIEGIYERLRLSGCNLQFPTQVQRRIYELFWFGWNGNVAMDCEERLSSRFGMESRFPFFDRRLVEFLLAVPDEQRWSGCWPKMILRTAMEGILPEPVRMRQDKAEFSCLLDLELKGKQAEKIREIIRTSRLGRLGIIDSNRLEQLFEDYQKGIGGNDSRVSLDTFIWIEMLFRPQMN